ncbi:MAG: electron transfer flavoprotein subunit beta/FixA family protein [Chloroflexi bacterium]|nr:electron transfer flavoprotein subunit beta/FixA family protein [Ardenticatenaceae bacterium]MBL1130391.1 electron transfer flavoprotein beta subunit/FixA family protein [Chloroflexota bacterium]NOG36482.1 electron transfer flavoprotein subunit beta/FixA family protein [Chloroflexota bacterium]GIK58681.1 MAG: electron transfer flavoprotein subunit beta [Chloroflexota bacterium]
MNILVCIKRVPATGARITLTADERGIDTRNLGFTISPHEECAVEEAVRLVEQFGGSVTVLTLGPAEAAEQLRDALAVGADRAIHLLTDGAEWDPLATANAIIEAARAESFDLLLFGNEAADTGDYQVGIRVAVALGLPCVTGVKGVEVRGETVIARRDFGGGWEMYQVPLPAVFTVKEGLNLPRYPSVPGRLRAKKKPLEQREPARQGGGATSSLEMIRLATPPEQGKTVQILGQGVTAVPRIVEILHELRLV